MRVAAIYDVHGNLPALEAVLAHIDREGVDLIVSGGDVVLGPIPDATLERLLALGDRVRYIRGNTDRMVAEPPQTDQSMEKLHWVRTQLNAGQIAAVGGWDERLALDIDGLGATLFVHATARNDHEIITPATPEAAVRLTVEGVEQPTIVCGHIHVQYDRRVAGKRLVNAGSVGMPYGDRPGAYWVLLGPDVQHMFTPYDTEATAQLVRDSGMPGAAEFAVENIARVPTADTAIERFEPKAVKAPTG